jgi:hypothetical protein
MRGEKHCDQTGKKAGEKAKDGTPVSSTATAYIANHTTATRDVAQDHSFDADADRATVTTIPPR